MPAEDLPEGDDGADGRDRSHQPDAARLRVDGPTDALGDDPPGLHGERGPVGEPVELGAQPFGGRTRLQANGHEGLAGHHRLGVEQPGRQERGGVAVLQGLGRIDDADQLGVEGVPLGRLREEASPVELLARPAHQREPLAELRVLLVHEPRAGDELVRIGRVGGTSGNQARRRQPGAGEGDGPLALARRVGHAGEDEGDGLDRCDARQCLDLRDAGRPGSLADGRVQLAANGVGEGIGGLGRAAGTGGQREDRPCHDGDDPRHDEHREPPPAQRGADPEHHSPHPIM